MRPFWFVKASSGDKKIPDVAVAKVACKEELLSQCLSFPLYVNGSPDMKRLDDALLITTWWLSHYLDVPSPAEASVQVPPAALFRGIIYSDPKHEGDERGWLGVALGCALASREPYAQGRAVLSNVVVPVVLRPRSATSFHSERRLMGSRGLERDGEVRCKTLALEEGVIRAVTSHPEP